MKDFLMFVHKMEKKDEDYMQITYKKNLSISTCLLALHLFTALQQKLITTFTKCLSVKELTVCQNTFSHVEITCSLMRKQLCSINKQENYSKALYYKSLEQHKNFLPSQENCYIDEVLTFQKTPSFFWSSNNLNG